MNNRNFNDVETNIAMDNFINQFLVIQNVKTKNVIGSLHAGYYVSNGLQGYYVINMEPEVDNDAQQYIIFPIDGGLYLIASKSTGRILQLGSSGQPYYNMPTTDQLNISTHWNFYNIQDNIFQIYDELNNFYLIPDEQQHLLASEKNYTGSDNQKWMLKPLQDVKIPIQPPLETIEPIPAYQDPNDILPLTTEKKLVGWTLIPYMMVNDSNLSNLQKINLYPYYVMERYDYWLRLENSSLAPGETLSTTTTIGTTTTTQTEMDQTVDMTVDQSLGFQFTKNTKIGSFGGTADLKQHISNDLKTSVSLSEQQMVSQTKESDRPNPSDDGSGKKTYLYARYVLASEFVLKRPSFSDYDPDVVVNSWTFTRTDTRGDTDIEL